MINKAIEPTVKQAYHAYSTIHCDHMSGFIKLLAGAATVVTTLATSTGQVLTSPIKRPPAPLCLTFQSNGGGLFMDSRNHLSD